MPETTGETPAASETPAAPAEEPFDKERAMATINNLRGFEKTAKAQERQLAELNAKLQEYDQSKLTETERLQKQAQDASQKAQSIQQLLQEKSAALAIERASRSLNIVDGETAAALIRSKIEFDDNGDPTNVESLLKDLVKNKPFLVAQEGGGGTPPSNPQRSGGYSMEDIAKMTPQQIASLPQAEYDKIQAAIKAQQRR